MRRWCLLLALAVVPALLPADDDVVFRSDVSLVRVDAQVVGADGHAITGLRATDFVLREEGRPQPIRNFASENMPVDVLLLLDVSASMRPHIQRIASAGRESLRVLGADDRVGIMVFDRSTRLRLGFHKNLRDVEDELQTLLDQESFRGGTDITRGLLDAADYVRNSARRDARRAIVIVTDDQTEFGADIDGVSRALTRADAVLCAILAPDAMRHRTMGGGSPQGGGWPGGGGGGPLGGIILGRQRGPYGGRGPGGGGPRTRSAGTADIARRSGGDSMPIDDSYAFESTLSRIRRRYALYFNIPEGVRAGEERRIRVELADAALGRYPGADVRYRAVYVAPAAGSWQSPSRGSQQPAMVTGGSPAPADDTSSRRRRPVADMSGGGHDGPLLVDNGSSSAPAPPPVSSPAASSAGTNPPAANPAPAATSDPDPPGGWRKARPDEK